MKTHYLTLVVVLGFLCVPTYGQISQPVYIGINPSVQTNFSSYLEGYDFNVVPIIFRTPIHERADAKIVSMVSYRQGFEQGISKTGIAIGIPIYFQLKRRAWYASNGFYAGPNLGFSKDLLNENLFFDLAGELGYLHLFENNLGMGIQFILGQSNVFYPDGTSTWELLTGFGIEIGYWLNN